MIEQTAKIWITVKSLCKVVGRAGSPFLDHARGWVQLVNRFCLTNVEYLLHLGASQPIPIYPWVDPTLQSLKTWGTIFCELERDLSFLVLAKPYLSKHHSKAIAIETSKLFTIWEWSTWLMQQIDFGIWHVIIKSSSDLHYWSHANT